MAHPQGFYQPPNAQQQPQQPQQPQQGFGNQQFNSPAQGQFSGQNQQNGYHGGRPQNGGGRGGQYNDQLIQTINYGFPFNHLITVALMQRVPQPNLQYPDMKEKMFFFLTLAPGVGDAQNRTYDFQNGRVSMKFSTREICGLAEVLKNVAIGNTYVLPYAKFTRSQAGGSKSCSVWTSQKQQQSGQNNNIVVNQVNITISAEQKQTVALNSEQALGVGNILSKLFDKAVEMEFKLQLEQPTASANRSGGGFNPT